MGMIFSGEIRLDRELTFRQAKQLVPFLEGKGLALDPNGQILKWDGKDPITEHAVADVLKELLGFGVRVIGIIVVKDDDRHVRDIIIIRDMVKVHENNVISTMKVSSDTRNKI